MWKEDIKFLTHSNKQNDAFSVLEYLEVLFVS